MSIAHVLTQVRTWGQKAFVFCVCLIAFLLPFEPQFLAVIEIATVFSFLLGYAGPGIVKKWLNQKWAWPWLLFYALLLIHCLPDTHNAEAVRQLNVKLPFVLLPLLLAALHRAQAALVLRWFVYGCAAACLVLLPMAGYAYLNQGQRDAFTYSAFSRFVHVTYFSTQLLMAAALVLTEWVNGEPENGPDKNSKKMRTAVLLLLALFGLCILLVSAKVTLALFVPFSLVCVWHAGIKLKKRAWAAGLTLLFCALPFLLYLASPGLRQRTDYALQELKHPLESPTGIASTGVRIFVWKNTLPQVRQAQPWGIGPQNVQPMLNRLYLKANFEEGAKRQLNMHNEYLQQLTGMGVPGLLLLLLMLVLPALLCAPPYRLPGMLFTMAMATISTTESIFERQSGTIFFCLLALLLIIAYQKEQPPAPNS